MKQNMRTMRGVLALCAMASLAACDLFVSAQGHAERGRLAAAQGRYGLAAIELQNALKSEPDNLGYRLELASMLLLNSEPIAARSAIASLVAKDKAAISADVADLVARIDLASGDADALLTRLAAGELSLPPALTALRSAQAYIALRKSEQAAQAFEEALKLDASSVDAQLGLGESHLQRGDVERALNVLGEVLQKAPAHARALQLQGLALAQLGERVAAARAFTLADQHAAGQLTRLESMQLLGALVEQLVHLKDIDRAEARVKDLAVLDAKSALSAVSRAQVYFARGQFDAAGSELQALIAAQPDFAQARLLFSKTLFAQERWQQAEQQAQQALARLPGETDARIILARLYMRREQYAKAVEVLAPSTDAAVASDVTAAQAAAAKSQDALAELDESMRRRPGDEALRLAVAATYLREPNFEKAIELLRAKTDAPSLSRISLLMTAVASGRSAEGSQTTFNAEAAEREAERIAKESGSASAPLQMIGRFYLWAQRSTEARYWLARAAERAPRDVELRLELARLQLTLGELRGAEANVDKALALHGAHASARLLKAECLGQRRDFVGAIEQLEQVHKQIPWAAQPQLAMAAVRLAAGDVTQAQEILNELGRTAANRVTVQAQIGATWMRFGRNAQAAVAYAAAAVLQPDNAEHWRALAQAEFASARYSEARTAAKKALALNNSDSSALAMQAQADVKLGNTVAALDAVKLFRREHPKDIPAALLAADLLMADKQNVAAAEIYEQVAQEQPNAVAVLNNLAWVYFELQDPRAEATARRAYELLSVGRGGIQAASVADTYGWILLQKGNIAEALRILKGAVDKAGADSAGADIQHHYVVALARSGSREEARRRLQALLDSHPTFATRPDAEQLLKQL